MDVMSEDSLRDDSPGAPGAAFAVPYEGRPYETLKREAEERQKAWDEAFHPPAPPPAPPAPPLTCEVCGEWDGVNVMEIHLRFICEDCLEAEDLANGAGVEDQNEDN